MSKSPFHSELHDPVPSYEESIGSGPATLHQQLDDARLSRVRNVLSTYVDPLLAGQGASGIYRTIFLLVPYNVDSLQPELQPSYSSYSSPPKEPEIVGFASTDVVKLIRLEGEEHTVQFWRQPAVLEDLATNLRMRLKMSGHRVDEGSPAGQFSTSAVEIGQSAQNNKKPTGWFRSRSKKSAAAKSSLWASTAPSEATITDRKLGWRSAQEDAGANKSLGRGEVRVAVEWREICLRVETAVGLYDTRKGPGVCLSVEVGA
jgi:hypothetical protein